MAVIWRISGGYGGYLADKSTHPLPDKEELKYPCQSGTDRQKGGVFTYVYALCESGQQHSGQSSEK